MVGRDPAVRRVPEQERKRDLRQHEAEVPQERSLHDVARQLRLDRARHLPPGITHRKPTAIINGFPVYRVPSGKHSLTRAQVAQVGGGTESATKRILATLNRSPLSAVWLRVGSAQCRAILVVRRFGGLRFAVPGSWRVHRQKAWATGDRASGTARCC